MNHNILPPDLKFITDQTHKNNTGFCRHYMFLYSLVLGMEAKNVAEFGSGFSTQCIWTALKLTGGTLINFEQRDKSENASWFSEEMLNCQDEKWQFIQGDSLKTVPDFNHLPYDLVLHDGSHTGKVVTQDINNILPHIKKGGVLLLHDTNHPSLGAEMMRGISNSNIENYKHEILTLPYGFGLTLIKILDTDRPEEVNLTWRKGL